MNTTLHLARLVLEARSPLSIGAHKGGERDDVSLIVDAMGMPTIPASGLAGALRSMAADRYGEAFAKELFGHLGPKGGQKSRVVVGWGVCHGDDNIPLEAQPGTEDDARWQGELVNRLRSLAKVPIKRDRVALDHRATALARRKFDRSVVPKGTRFTVELRLWGSAESANDWQRLLALLDGEGVRVGGATRSGLGQLRVQSSRGRSFNLANPQDACDLRKLPARYDRPDGLPALIMTPADAATTSMVTCKITLKPEGFVRVGQGDAPFLASSVEGNESTLLTQKSEPVVVWSQGRGCIERSVPLIPASSIKGALSDRVAFHAHRHAGRFVDNAGADFWRGVASADVDPDALASYDKNRDTPEVQELFGRLDDRAGSRAGRVVLEDVWLPRPDDKGAARVTHNVIDRFTGGVREHLLFTEEVLFKPAITFSLQIRLPQAVSLPARRALREALDDLVNGMLPLGAASTRGNGYFFGELHWSDGGRWILGEVA